MSNLLILSCFSSQQHLAGFYFFILPVLPIDKMACCHNKIILHRLEKQILESNLNKRRSQPNFSFLFWYCCTPAGRAGDLTENAFHRGTPSDFYLSSFQTLSFESAHSCVKQKTKIPVPCHTPAFPTTPLRADIFVILV